MVDVLLADGAVLAADVVITVADVPLVGVQARVLLAGMTRLSEEGIFEAWDEEIRNRADRSTGAADD
nr:gas vesicle protein GvpJ [Halorubellus salinus]